MSDSGEFDELVERLRLLNEQNYWPSLLEAATAIQTLQSRLAESEARGERFVKALAKCEDAINEQFRYWEGGETKGSYDGKPERAALRNAQYIARAALNPENTHG